MTIIPFPQNCIRPELIRPCRACLISIFDNLLNNLIQQSNLLIISVEILGNYDTKTNQWVLIPKQLNLVLL